MMYDSQRNELRPSAMLLAAAFVGLSGVAACDSDESVEAARGSADTGVDGSGDSADGSGTGSQEADGSGAGAATGEPTVISVTVDESLTYEAFVSQCEEWGGYVETHASCSGANSCAGYSFNKYSFELSEHTCRGVNTCGGYSCVVLPTDAGRTGVEIWDAKCGGCHRAGDSAQAFAVYSPPGDPVAQLEAFRGRSAALQELIVAFGTHGFNQASAFSNMPAYRFELSRAEISRVVGYLRSLEPIVVPYDIPGEGSGSGAGSGGMGN